MWTQKEIILNNKNRGFHLVTNEIVQNLSELKTVSIGLLHIFLKHTSASLTLNENADQSVRVDFESHFNDMIPEGGNIIHIKPKEKMICLPILNHLF